MPPGTSIVSGVKTAEVKVLVGVDVMTDLYFHVGRRSKRKKCTGPLRSVKGYGGACLVTIATYGSSSI